LLLGVRNFFVPFFRFKKRIYLLVWWEWAILHQIIPHGKVLQGKRILLRINLKYKEKNIYGKT
jgi:hypothetical protein